MLEKVFVGLQISKNCELNALTNYSGSTFATDLDKAKLKACKFSSHLDEI